MNQSAAVRDGLLAFYARFSTGDPDQFGDIIAAGPGVSVIGRRRTRVTTAASPGSLRTPAASPRPV
jgi:hypothetical protein